MHPEQMRAYERCGDHSRATSGAAQRNKLEPFSAPSLLEELEDWSAIINAEPEVQKALEASVGTQLPELEP